MQRSGLACGVTLPASLHGLRFNPKTKVTQRTGFTPQERPGHSMSSVSQWPALPEASVPSTQGSIEKWNTLTNLPIIEKQCFLYSLWKVTQGQLSQRCLSSSCVCAESAPVKLLRLVYLWSLWRYSKSEGISVCYVLWQDIVMFV